MGRSSRRLPFAAIVVLAGRCLAAMGQVPAPAEPRPARPLVDIVDPLDAPALPAPPVVATPKRPRPSMDSAPASVAVRVSGTVRDLAGRPIAGATVRILLERRFDSVDWTVRWDVADATATTGADGRYRFPPVSAPTRDRGGPWPGTTPYVQCRVVAGAPGYGVGTKWGPSMYAVPLADPDDLSGRLPLDSPMEVEDVHLRPGAALAGRVVDEAGRPVAGVRVGGGEFVLLDEAGDETRFRSEVPIDLLRGGAVVTGADGRFRVAGLPAESCWWLRFDRPGSTMWRGVYAATSAPAASVHRRLEGWKFNGRERHAAEPSEMTVVMATPRRLDVRVVAEDDGAPVAGMLVHAGGAPDPAASARSGGRTDADGRVAIDLPPGTYDGLIAHSATHDTRFLGTEVKPLVVADGPAIREMVVRMKVGPEVFLEAVDADTGRGIPEVWFDIRAEGPGEEWHRLGKVELPMFGGDPTGADGKLRATLDPGRKGKQRVRVGWVGDIRLAPPATPPGVPVVPRAPGTPQPMPDVAPALPFEISPADGVAFEPMPGRPVTVRFRLRPK